MRPNFMPKGAPRCTSNACASGRRDCPTPDACRLPDDDDPREGSGAVTVPAIIALGLVIASALLAAAWKVWP